MPLTDDELATQLAFFLTDQPPDEALLAAARAGTLRANLAGHVDTLLASPAARDWLRTIIETYFELNTLPGVRVDADKFPFFSPALAADLGIESRMFLDDALWNGDLTDLLLSRRAFLNSNLATMVYAVPAPPGATPTTFVQTTLPADRRSGLLTNAALLTTRPHIHATNFVVPRGLLVSTVLLCMPHPGPDMPGSVAFDRQTTARQQVEMRAALPACSACHAQLDPYGLALENYDDFGRYRTIDERRPSDRRARHAARRDRRRRRGERRGARPEAGDQSRFHELHGENDAAVRAGRSRHQRRGAAAPAAGRVRDRRRRPAVPGRQRKDLH